MRRGPQTDLVRPQLDRTVEAIPGLVIQRNTNRHGLSSFTIQGSVAGQMPGARPRPNSGEVSAYTDPARRSDGNDRGARNPGHSMRGRSASQPTDWTAWSNRMKPARI